MNQFAKAPAELERLREIVREDKNLSPNRYDCVVHLSPTPASLYQLHLLRNVFGLKVLTVTFDAGTMSADDRQRLDRALDAFDVDHLRFNPRKSVLAKFKNGKVAEATQRFAAAAQRGMLRLSLFVARMYAVPSLVLDSETILPAQTSLPADRFVDVNSSEFTAFLQQSPLDLPSGEKFSRQDLIPYRLEDLALTGFRVACLGPWWDRASSEEREQFAAVFPWANPEPKGTAAQGNWHTLPGRRKTTAEAGRQRELTRYEQLAAGEAPGKALFAKSLRYCARCCMPETAESLAFDEMGMCQPCRSSEQKMHINWVERQQSLENILKVSRDSEGGNYDLIVPISGGKDSTFQLYVLTQKHHLRPLAVTFSHNWYTETGKRNLENSYDRFDVDHVMFIPRRGVINKLARKSLYMIGDSCWHCHSGVGSFPLVAAVGFGVKLLVWGESVSERDGRATYDKPILFDREYFTKISARFYAEQMVGDDISLFDVSPYILPSREALEKVGVQGIHLGDYIFWDDERQTEFVRDFWGWLEDGVEGAYKGFKSVECRMAGVHDYSKFIKRGFGRGTDQASIDVRTGLLTREEGFELARKYDSERPNALDFYLEITGYSEEEFERILKEKREGNAKKLP